MSHLLNLADEGLAACSHDAALEPGVNTLNGLVTHKGVARSLGYDHHTLDPPNK